MRLLPVLLLILAVVQKLFAQPEDGNVLKNLNFEEPRSADQEMPAHWFRFLGNYHISSDSVIVHSGKNAATIKQPDSGGNAGAIAQRIPADRTGNKLKLRGWLKRDAVEDGFAGFFLRIDGGDQILAFDNMQSRKLQGTSDWEQHEIMLPLAEQAEMIYFGALLVGKGQLWIDDIELLIDEQPLELAKVKIDAPAKHDTTYRLGSRVDSTALLKVPIGELALLGKVWGFLKYYHPEVASGNLNWDFELFRFIPEYLSKNSKASRNEAMYKWATSFKSPDTYGNDAKKNPDSLKSTSNLDWLNAENLGEDLYSMLSGLIPIERSTGYYVDIPEDVPIAHFQNEASYSSFSFPDIGYRLLAAYRYWNMVEYFFPYKYLCDEEWADVLDSVLPEFLGTKSEMDYLLTSAAMVSKINDSHAYLQDRSGRLMVHSGLKHAGVSLNYVENKVVLSDLIPKALKDTTALQIGDVVTHINQEKVEKLFERQRALIPASNKSYFNMMATRMLTRTNADSIEFSIETGKDQRRELKLPTYSFQELPYPPLHRYRDTCFKLLDEQTAYLNPTTLSVKYLPEIMAAVRDRPFLIVDLRTYPRESFVKFIGDYLFKEPTEFVQFSHTSIQKPGDFKMLQGMKIGPEHGADLNYFEGRVYVLVNELAMSNAEFTVMALQARKGTVVIGSQTAGADGNVIPSLNLPGGLSSSFTGLGVYYPDGSETQRIGIRPDFEVFPTIQGVREGRDEVLEFSLKMIRSQQSLSQSSSSL